MKTKYRIFNDNIFILTIVKIKLMTEKLFKHINYDENGEMQTNKKKLEIMVHYIIDCIGGLSHFGKTVLWKLMYFSDFDFYEQYEKPITGEIYCKLEHGPAPRNFNQIIDNLKEEKKIRQINTEYHGHKQVKYLSLDKPNIDKLSTDEIETIKRTINRFIQFNAKQISEYSHLDIPWKATEDKQIIKYELVFYREPITSVREYDNN